MHNFKLPLALWMAAATLALTGCASRNMLALENRYEKTRLPAHFDRTDAKDDNYVSLAVGCHEQQSMAFMDMDSALYTVRNAALSIDGSFLFEKEIFHFGFGLGISPVDDGLVRVGGFGGITQNVGTYLITSLTGGVFLNNNLNNARYEDVEWFLIFPTTTEDSTAGNVGHMEIPIRANLTFDTRTGFSPFVSYSMNAIGIGIKDAGENLGIQEVAVGALWDLPRGNALHIEASAMQAAVIGKEPLEGDARTGSLMGVRVAYVKKL